jgi:hypothetical protein
MKDFPSVKTAWLPHPEPFVADTLVSKIHNFLSNHINPAERCLFLSRKDKYQAGILVEEGKASWRLIYGLSTKFHPPVTSEQITAAQTLSTHADRPMSIALTGDRREIRELFENLHLYDTTLKSFWLGHTIAGIWIPNTYDPFNL